jgi:GntR family transcriptional regulator
MFFKPHPASGVPMYLQLMDQVKHAIETGALRPGEQLPGLRKVAEQLVMNPNTVAKAYRELEHEGVIELRQGTGAFVAERTDRKRERRFHSGQPILEAAVRRLSALGISEDEMRRLFESEMIRLREKARAGKRSDV